MQFRKGIRVRNLALYLFLFLALWQNPDKSKLRKAFWVELIVMGACCWSSSHPLQTRSSGKGWRSAAFLLFHFVIHYGPLVHGIVPPTIRVGLPKLNVSKNTLMHVQRCVFLDSKSAQADMKINPEVHTWNLRRLVGNASANIVQCVCRWGLEAVIDAKERKACRGRWKPPKSCTLGWVQEVSWHPPCLLPLHTCLMGNKTVLCF